MTSGSFSIAIHGGGVWKDKRRGSDEDYLRSLARILDAGRCMARAGDSAVDIAQVLTILMEDDPLYKAGRGSGASPGEIVTMDAAIMDGASQRYGSVTTLRNVRNPIRLARYVMDFQAESMLVGPGAEEAARKAGLPFESDGYFIVAPPSGLPGQGTVGAVAFDAGGNLAAASSTGGFPGHSVSPWRVGDTPLIGAGTLADNRSCAISTCGHGERFVAAGVTRRIAARIEFANLDVHSAVDHTLRELRASGSPPTPGGVVCVARDGTVCADVSNEFCMACGWIEHGGAARVRLIDKPLP